MTWFSSGAWSYQVLSGTYQTGTQLFERRRRGNSLFHKENCFTITKGFTSRQLSHTKHHIEIGCCWLEKNGRVCLNFSSWNESCSTKRHLARMKSMQRSRPANVCHQGTAKTAVLATEFNYRTTKVSNLAVGSQICMLIYEICWWLSVHQLQKLLLFHTIGKPFFQWLSR